jgi:integrase
VGRRPAFERRARAWVGGLRGYSPATVRNYGETAAVMAREVRSLDLDANLTRWTAKEIEVVLDLWRSRDSAGRLAKKVVILKGILRSVRNPVLREMAEDRALRLPRQQRGHVRWHSAQERSRMLETSTGALRLALEFGYLLGLRRSEISNLRLEDVHASSVVILGKGGKVRELPLEGLMRSELDRWLELRAGLVDGTPDPPVEVLVHRRLVSRSSLGYNKKYRCVPYTPQAVTSLISEHARRLGMTASSHDLRRTFARSLYERGVDLVTISALLGHSSPSVTVMYIGVGLDHMRTALAGFYADF